MQQKQEEKRGRGRPVRDMYELDGVAKPLGWWARKLGVPQSTLSRRLASGWGLRDALTTPSRKAD